MTQFFRIDCDTASDHRVVNRGDAKSKLWVLASKSPCISRRPFVPDAIDSHSKGRKRKGGVERSTTRVSADASSNLSEMSQLTVMCEEEGWGEWIQHHYCTFSVSDPRPSIILFSFLFQHVSPRHFGHLHVCISMFRSWLTNKEKDAHLDLSQSRLADRTS